MSQETMTISERKAKMYAEVFAYLRKEAEDWIYYIALRRVLKREDAEKFGVTEEEAGDILSTAAVELVDDIRRLEGR